MEIFKLVETQRPTVRETTIAEVQFDADASWQAQALRHPLPVFAFINHGLSHLYSS